MLHKIFLSIPILYALAAHGFPTVDTVGRYRVYGIKLPFDQSKAGDVWDNTQHHVSGRFISPAGRIITVGGFYHSRNKWMVRFVPDEIGTWTWVAVVGTATDSTALSGSLRCVASGEPGFIRKHPHNPKRQIYESNGALYAGVGFGDCMGANRDSIFEYGPMDGYIRPKGYHEGIDWNVPYSQYLNAYGDMAGFNLYRYSDENCAYTIRKTIGASGNDYDTLHSLWTDTLFAGLRAHGFRIYMTVLNAAQGSSSDAASMNATKRYLQYCIDRYGAYVDFWELTNESSPDSLWISICADYVHANDPYHHLVSVSWEKPAHPSIDIISPHWYGKEADNASDVAVDAQLQSYRSTAKPVIFGEQGDGSAVDANSVMRMRGRVWSALFNEATIIFWNSSFAMDCCNQYLGWDSRQEIRALQNFSDLLDSGVVRTFPAATPSSIHGWGLRSSRCAAAYIRNDGNVSGVTTGATIVLDVPVDGYQTIYDVHTGAVLTSTPVTAGRRTITLPSFITDIAVFAGPVVISQRNIFSMTLTPRTHGFLGVPARSTSKFPVVLHNTGLVADTITQIIITGGAALYSTSSIKSLPAVLNPDDTMQVVVTYAPMDTGAKSAMISFVRSNSPVWENLAVVGTALPALGVRDFVPTSITAVYPNPASIEAVVHINLNSPDHARTVEIADLIGRVVAVLGVPLSGVVSVNVSRLPQGVYALRAGGEIRLMRVVKD